MASAGGHWCGRALPRMPAVHVQPGPGMRIAPYGRPLQHIPMHNRREARLPAEPTVVRTIHRCLGVAHRCASRLRRSRPRRHCCETIALCRWSSLNVQVAAGTPKAAWWTQRFLQGTGFDCEREKDQGHCLWEQSELLPIALWWITCWGGCILLLSRNWVAPERVIEDRHRTFGGSRAKSGIFETALRWPKNKRPNHCVPVIWCTNQTGFELWLWAVGWWAGHQVLGGHPQKFPEKPLRCERHHSQSDSSSRIWQVPTDPILASASIEIQSQDVHLTAIPLDEFSI